MKPLALIYILLLLVQASFAHHPDSLSGTFKIRKPPGWVYTTGAYPSAGYSFEYTPIGKDTVVSDYSMRGNNTLMTSARKHNGMYVLDIEYPAKARQNGLAGTVFVSFEYGENGKPVNIKLQQGCHPELDKVALDYVRTIDTDISAEEILQEADGRYTIAILFSLWKAPD